MFPPSQSINLDIEALSGICGSISIACWVVVFSPQIIENFRRHSADGLSVIFLVAWLMGDVFNILGAILQGVLPTMLILAVYYTLADIVLLCQVFYYRGFTLSDEIKTVHDDATDDETQPLLLHANSQRHSSNSTSTSVLQRRFSLDVDGTHLSPVTPLLAAPGAPTADLPPSSPRQAALLNTFAILLVCAAGVCGWWIGTLRRRHHPDKVKEDHPDDALQLDPLGQVFGYLCAALYLGSRVPQLLLNYRRKSTEGVSLLFFLFACIGNLTYDMSIFAYKPVCRSVGHCEPGEAMGLYGKYILVNASWIAGSLGTLMLDLAIFVQFFLYQKEDEDDEDDEEEVQEVQEEGHVAILITDERSRSEDL